MSAWCICVHVLCVCVGSECLVWVCMCVFGVGVYVCVYVLCVRVVSAWCVSVFMLCSEMKGCRHMNSCALLM